MKKIDTIVAASLAVAITAGSAFAFAGDRERRAPEPAAVAEQMQKRLQLDDTQRAKVQGILEQSRAQREALAQQYKIAERDAFMKEMKTLHEQTREQIDALLTPAQREAMQAQHDRHGKFGKRGHGRHGDHGKPDDSAR